MSINFRITSASPNDIDAIMSIEHDAFDEGIIENQTVFQERIDTFPDGFLVVKHQNQIIAYLASEIWIKKASYSQNDFTLGHSIQKVHDLNGSEIYIASMGVLKAYRGQGIGHFLFNELFNRIKINYPKISSAVLIVSTDWQNAQKIYLKTGFQEIGRLSQFFELKPNHFHDAIIMRRSQL